MDELNYFAATYYSSDADNDSNFGYRTFYTLRITYDNFFSGSQFD